MAQRQSSRASKPGKRGDAVPLWVKRLVIAIPVVAAALTIAGYLIGWFGGHSASPLPSGAAEYLAVCTLANTERGRWSHEAAEFRPKFESAPNPTKARDALLYLTEADIRNASALWSALYALTPVAAMAETQARLLGAWSSSLAILRTYQDHLSVATSTPQLITLTQSLPRAQLEQNATLARALLVRLGGFACNLNGEVVQPVADISSAVTRILSGGHGGAVSTVRPDVRLQNIATSHHSRGKVSPPLGYRPHGDSVASGEAGIPPAVHGPVLVEGSPEG